MLSCRAAGKLEKEDLLLPSCRSSNTASTPALGPLHVLFLLPGILFPRYVHDSLSLRDLLPGAPFLNYC